MSDVVWSAKKRGVLIKRLRPWVYIADERTDPCAMIKLSITDAEGREIRGVTRFFQPWPTDIEVLVSSIIEFIQGDADQRPGQTTRYMLTPLYGQGSVPGDEAATITATGRRDEEEGLNDAPSEPATPTGMRAQEMRHMEILQRQMTGMIDRAMDKLVTENARLSTRSEADDSRRIKFFNDLEKVATELHKRKMEEDDKKFQRENAREVISMLKPIIPFAVNKATGTKLLAEPNMEDQLLEEFFGDMSCTCTETITNPECEWHNMLKAASPKRQIMLNMMAKKAIENKEKKEGTYQGDRAAEASIETDPEKH